MTEVRCNSETCLHCYQGVCRRDQVKMQMIEVSPFVVMNVCKSHEAKTDFVEFMEKRGVG